MKVDSVNVDSFTSREDLSLQDGHVAAWLGSRAAGPAPGRHTFARRSSKVPQNQFRAADWREFGESATHISFVLFLKLPSKSGAKCVGLVWDFQGHCVHFVSRHMPHRNPKIASTNSLWKLTISLGYREVRNDYLILGRYRLEPKRFGSNK